MVEETLVAQLDRLNDTIEEAANDLIVEVHLIRVTLQAIAIASVIGFVVVPWILRAYR